MHSLYKNADGMKAFFIEFADLGENIYNHTLKP